MYGNYYPNAVLEAVNYVSVVMAAIVYGLILVKFLRVERKSGPVPAPVIGTGA